jgi:hypothetical protein
MSFNGLFSGLLLMFQFHPKAKEKRLLVSPNPAGSVLAFYFIFLIFLKFLFLY